MDMLEPGKFGTEVPFRKRYDNFIGGQWVAPVEGRYFENVTPVTGKVFCEIARSSAADVERALLVGHNPGLEDLVLLLSAESNPLRGAVEEKFPTASVAVLELDGDWAGACDGCGHLTTFVRPRDLDPSLGPGHD